MVINDVSWSFTYRAKIFVVLLAGMMMQGCALSDRVELRDAEGLLPENTLQTLKSGKADKPWVLAHLGKPDRIDKAVSVDGDAFDVFTYAITKRHVRTGHVLFLMRAGTVDESSQYLHVAFENGVLVKQWRDQHPMVYLGVHTRDHLSTLDHLPGQVKQKDPIDWKLPILKKWFAGEQKKTAQAPAEPSDHENPHESDN